jgi:hypothetical protein
MGRIIAHAERGLNCGGDTLGGPPLADEPVGLGALREQRDQFRPLAVREPWRGAGGGRA